MPALAGVALVERLPGRGVSLAPAPEAHGGNAESLGCGVAARCIGDDARLEVRPMPSTRTPFAVLLVATSLAASTVLAHGWEELDVRRALAEADAVVAVAEAVELAWAPAPGAAVEPVGAPPELRYWTWVQARRAQDGDASVLAAISVHAPEWLDAGDPPDVVAEAWVGALGELLAHAAGRAVDDADRAAAMADLRRADLDAAAAARASWIAVLPVLNDAERRDLAPAFARLDALVAAVAQ